MESNVEIPQILEFSNPLNGASVINDLDRFSILSEYPIVFGKKIWVNITENMRILANGNIGIGTATPSAKLHVAGSGIFDGNVGIGTTGPTAKLEVKDLLWNITVSPNRDWLSSTININAYSAWSSGLEIGHGYFWGGFGFIKSNEPFLVYISKLNIPDFFISTGGNVGIGTATLTAKLEVNWDIKIASTSAWLWTTKIYKSDWTEYTNTSTYSKCSCDTNRRTGSDCSYTTWTCYNQIAEFLYDGSDKYVYYTLEQGYACTTPWTIIYEARAFWWCSGWTKESPALPTGMFGWKQLDI